MGVIDLAHICGSESMMDAVHHAKVVGSACAGLERDALSGHRVRSSDVCSVGESFFESDDVSIMHNQKYCRTIHT